MYATYHLQSAQDVTADILEAIKATFKSKPIVITVEEGQGDATAYLTSSLANKTLLDQSIEQAKNDRLVEVKPEDL